MEMKLGFTYSLCPNCEACPTVEVLEDQVRIGEDENLVELRIEEWNRLVEAIKAGELREIDCGCGCV